MSTAFWIALITPTVGAFVGEYFKRTWTGWVIGLTVAIVVCYFMGEN